MRNIPGKPITSVLNRLAGSTRKHSARAFIITGLLLAVCCIERLEAQVDLQIVIRADSSASVRSTDPLLNDGTSQDFFASAWTCNSGTDTCVHRSLIDFDLSGIDSSWVITDIRLDLFGNPTSGRPANAGFNAIWIERVTSDWSPNMVNWENQPSTTSTNRISLVEETMPEANSLDLNVIDLVTDMLADPAGSFGMRISLQDENIFRSRVFASGNHPDESIRPTLRISYTELGSGSTGLQDEELYRSMQIFPNPANTFVNVRLQDVPDALMNLSLQDMTGRALIQQSIQVLDKQVQLDLSDIPAGLYMMVLSTDQGVASRPLVVQ